MKASQKKDIAKALALLDEAKGIFEVIRDEEQERFDKMTEKRQESPAGEELAEMIETLETAIDEIGEIDAALGGELP